MWQHPAVAGAGYHRSKHVWIDGHVGDGMARVEGARRRRVALTSNRGWLGLTAAFTGNRRNPLKNRKKLTNLQNQFPTTRVMKERKTPRPAYILIRGEYDKQGELVGRKTPQALPPMPPDLPPDRLGFAKWLVAPDHPLVARVAANRFWQQVFGVGLVKTSEDLSSQGEWPSHPELLDHLARCLIDSGWDVKALMRQTVTSRTYRQRSDAGPEACAVDPENRGPREPTFVSRTPLSIGCGGIARSGTLRLRPVERNDVWS